MKKVLAIVLILAGLLGLGWGFERRSAASGEQARADESLAKAQTALAAGDQQAFKGESDWVEISSRQAADTRKSATLGLGGGAVLLVGGLVLLLRGRKRA